MNLNKKFDLYCWACDFSPNRGEGILARHYIKKLSKIKKKKFTLNHQMEFTVYIMEY